MVLGTVSFSTFLTYATIGKRKKPGNIATYRDLISSKVIMSSCSIISSNGIISRNYFVSSDSIVTSKFFVSGNGILSNISIIF